MTLNSRQQKYYELGKEYAEKYNHIKDAYNCMDFELLSDICEGCYSNGLLFDAGFIGREPEWREAYRYGEIPTEGRSVNHADNKWENGVSVIGFEDKETIYDVTLGYQGIDKIKIAGWYLGGSGSDGEPLLVDCVKL